MNNYGFGSLKNLVSHLNKTIYNDCESIPEIVLSPFEVCYDNRVYVTFFGEYIWDEDDGDEMDYLIETGKEIVRRAKEVLDSIKMMTLNLPLKFD